MKNRNRARNHVGLVLVLVGLMSGVTLMTAPVRLVSAQVPAPSWSYTGSLNEPGDASTATLLQNGNVLSVGTSSTELYDPTAGSWSYAGNLNTARDSYTATLLPNGRVLVAGGGYSQSPSDYQILNTAELYDPVTRKWSGTGKLNFARSSHTATLLPNGKVLVAGGYSGNSAELYDPATGIWSNTGSLHAARGGFTATLLPNGKVLVAGGGYNNVVLNSAELYNPATGTWDFTANLNAARGSHTATLLSNGNVLVAGGYNFVSGGDLNAELYDPATGTWSITGYLTTSRECCHTATLLQNGTVLVTGGIDFDAIPGHSRASRLAELYAPATGMWSATANPNTARIGHTATLLSNGKVLVAGGSDNSAELYDPGINPIPNQIDDAQFFVYQHYLDFLNRQPDQGGWDYWTNRITACGSDARCVHERRIGVSAAFFVELEFQDTGYYIYRFYKASFGRQPNYAEFTSDRSKVIGGSNLEANEQAFADEWVQRPAFTEAYPNTMSNAEFVNKLFDTGGLTASIYDTQGQQEIQAMNAGRSRALVLRDVIEIPDFKSIPDPTDPRYGEIKRTSQYNSAFVLMQYFGYLRRDVDQDGYDFWLNVVNNRKPNNYRGMVCAFITSTEYQLRFGSVVTRSNADCGH